MTGTAIITTARSKRRHEKYSGKKEWCDTLYYSKLTDEEIIDFGLKGVKSKDGYECPGIFDIEYYFGFMDKNDFRDTNDFITYSEIFNIYQFGKI